MPIQLEGVPTPRRIGKQIPNRRKDTTTPHPTLHLHRPTLTVIPICIGKQTHDRRKYIIIPHSTLQLRRPTLTTPPNSTRNDKSRKGAIVVGQPPTRPQLQTQVMLDPEPPENAKSAKAIGTDAATTSPAHPSRLCRLRPTQTRLPGRPRCLPTRSGVCLLGEVGESYRVSSILGG